MNNRQLLIDWLFILPRLMSILLLERVARVRRPDLVLF